MLIFILYFDTNFETKILTPTVIITAFRGKILNMGLNVEAMMNLRVMLMLTMLQDVNLGAIHVAETEAGDVEVAALIQKQTASADSLHQEEKTKDIPMMMQVKAICHHVVVKKQLRISHVAEAEMTENVLT
jgi:hypothetical protein